jgi:hypothetical protein
MMIMVMIYQQGMDEMRSKDVSLVEMCTHSIGPN